MDTMIIRTESTGRLPVLVDAAAGIFGGWVIEVWITAVDAYNLLYAARLYLEYYLLDVAPIVLKAYLVNLGIRGIKDLGLPSEIERTVIRWVRSVL